MFFDFYCWCLLWCFWYSGKYHSSFSSLSFFRTDVDVGVDGGNDGVGRFMMDFSRYDG